MKISVVTISFNQAKYLQACIDSVARQDGDWEHIIVDPGSTDGSRDIIEANRRHFSRIILEPDKGPADGLNRGFAAANGDIYYYLNSDDIVLANAFLQAVEIFKSRTCVDVVSGHAYVIDSDGRQLRKVWSNPTTKLGLAHGGSILIQPATFIRRRAFELTDGFNVENRSNWDGELFIDMFLAGAHFVVTEQYWAAYRIHRDSITGSGKLSDQHRAWSRRKYRMIMGRNRTWSCAFLDLWFRIVKVLRRPESLVFRMRRRRVFGAFSETP